MILYIVAALLTLVGTVWQTGIAVAAGLESLQGFQGDFNRLVKEETRRAYASIPRWNVFHRRRAAKEIINSTGTALTADEIALVRRYDRQAYGWSFLVIGASVAVWAAVAESMSV